MNQDLRHLDALALDPALKVSPEQRPAIVGNILHHLMHPYFLKRSPEMQEKFGLQQYQAFMAAMADYCLRGYIENPEPRLTIEFIKGLHRQFYSNAPSVPVKAVDGTMTTMVPGEFKTVPVYVRQKCSPDNWLLTTAPEKMVDEIALLLTVLCDDQVPLFQRYIHLIVELIRIHPFPDGNGKVAMLLGDLFLLNHGVPPPYFAKYKQGNERMIYGLYDGYFLDPQRDISAFYPVVTKAYSESGFFPTSE